MTLLSQIFTINFAVLSIFLPMQSHAYCAKCAAIEQKRAEENALNGPQPQRYYDQDYKDKITTINKSSTDTQNDTRKPLNLQQEYKDK